MYISYNPNNPIHKRLPLYELITEQQGNITAFVYRPVPESDREQANATPWYYAVKIEIQ